MERYKDLVWVTITLLLLLLSYGVGYAQGAKAMVNWGVDAVTSLLLQDKIDIVADKEMIKNGILQYKNNIGGCLFLENAPISNDSWNSLNGG